MRINFVFSQCYQNFKRENATTSGKEIIALKPKKESMPLTVGGTSGESNIANLWKDHFSAIANCVGSTDNRGSGHECIGAVPVDNDVINVHELRQIVK